MTGLHELFEETAGAAAPPSRLLADDLYTAGRRRLRRRRQAVAASAVVAVLATLSVSAVATGTLGPRRAPDRPAPAATSSAGPYPDGPVQWVGAADASHLYVAVTARADVRSAKRVFQLSGSTDGGRTWSARGGPLAATGFETVGRDTLLAQAIGPDLENAGPGGLEASTDGGRTWSPVRAAAPVTAVPAGQTAVCWSAQPDGSCRVSAVDPASRRVAPLTGQPRLRLDPGGPRIEQVDGRLWVSGIDPVTARPAVAVSADAGRTWSIQAFRDGPSCPLDGCAPPSVVTTDGQSGYAVLVGVQRRAVYRRAPDGRWRRVSGADAVPSTQLYNGPQSFVTSDGRHVLFETIALSRKDVTGLRAWAAPGGGMPDGHDRYQRVELAGLPLTVATVHRTPDGWYYALDFLAGNVYGSSDGWRWTKLTAR